MAEQTPDLKISVDLSETNRFYIECDYDAPDINYAFYLCKGEEEVIDRVRYSPKAHATFWLTDPGEYKIKVFVQHQGEKNAFLIRYSQVVHFEGIFKNLSLETGKKISIFYPIVSIFKELWQNRARMWRVAMYDRKIQTKDSYLGSFWELLNPLIQIAIFWFVFGIGFRGGAEQDNFPYLIWMLSGLIPWFFISAAIVKGSGSVHSKAGVVLRLRYPLACVPVGAIIENFYSHVITMGILILVFLGYGYMPTVYWLNLLYFMFSSVVFLSALSFVTSTLTMMARDFQNLLVSLIRLLFYVTPILWSLSGSTMPGWVQLILKLNPAYYLVQGFRDSMLYQHHFYENMPLTLYFWGLTLLLIVIGCNMHYRTKERFIDML